MLFNLGLTLKLCFENSTPYNRKSFEETLSVISILETDLGGTDVLSPLTHIFSNSSKNRICSTSLLISDGQVEQPTNCVALAIKNRTNH
jgi:hypothetical protein